MENEIRKYTERELIQIVVQALHDSYDSNFLTYFPDGTINEVRYDNLEAWLQTKLSPYNKNKE